MTWITEIIPGSPALWLGAGLWTVVVVGATAWTATSLTGGKNTVTIDTLYRDRTITKTDTVTQTVPRTVIRYDTVTEVDTAYMPVPTDWRPRGAIGSAPLDISGGDATLTYWDPQSRRWTQNVYALPEETWAIGLQGDVIAGPWLQATSTLGVTRGADVGWFDFRGRLGAGYGALVTDEYRAGPVVHTTLTITYDW